MDNTYHDRSVELVLQAMGQREEITPRDVTSITSGSAGSPSKLAVRIAGILQELAKKRPNLAWIASKVQENLVWRQTDANGNPRKNPLLSPDGKVGECRYKESTLQSRKAADADIAAADLDTLLARDDGIQRAKNEKIPSSKLPRKGPEAVDLADPPGRIPITIHRIIRDTDLARRVKERHGYKCQLCGHAIELSDGKFYAEAHHLQPLGKPHNGVDVDGNILCVCPNHHAQLDFGAIPLDIGNLPPSSNHTVNERFVNYHNKEIYQRSSGIA